MYFGTVSAFAKYTHRAIPTVPSDIPGGPGPPPGMNGLERLRSWLVGQVAALLPECPQYLSLVPRKGNRMKRERGGKGVAVPSGELGAAGGFR